MNEERRMILQMLQEGQISIEEAERLLEAVPGSGQSSSGLLSSGGELMPKRVHVLVSENGSPKVNVRIPFSLLRVGLKLGQSFGAKYISKDAESYEDIVELLGSLDVDEILQSISGDGVALPYKIIDVDEQEKNQHIEIVLE